MDQEQNKRADGLPLYARPHVLRRAREPKVGGTHHIQAKDERRHGLQHENLWGTLLRMLLRRAALAQILAY